MGVINTAHASVSALIKYYSTNDTQFYPIVSAAGQYPDEFYAATIHDTITTSQTIIRFIQSSGDTWNSFDMLDAVTSAVIAISGTTSSNFARLGNYIVYSNYDDEVKIIKTRTSSEDTNNNYVFKAGLPDPDATTIIDRMDEASNWEVRTGIGTITKDTAPVHRTQGTGSILFSNNTGDTSIFKESFGSALDLTSFTDGTDSNLNDYIALELFRFSKPRIKNLTIQFYSDTAASDYYEVSLVATPTVTDQDGNSWDNYHEQQSTFAAQWKIDPYDNRMFNVRIRKGWFASANSPEWSSITTMQVLLVSDNVTTSKKPCSVCIDNVRLLKTPPLATNFRIQVATFEHSESGSTDGWEKSECATASSFNHDITREGYASLVVTRCATAYSAGGTATATLRFDTAKSFMTYPDGSTASTGDVLKVNVWWKGLSSTMTWSADYTNFIPPRVRFTDSLGNYSQVKVWCISSLLGGGDTKQMRFNPTGGGLWSSTGTAADFTDIEKISIWGPYHCSLQRQ